MDSRTVAVVSDLHLGAKQSVLVEETSSGEFRPTKEFANLKAAVSAGEGRIEALVVLGDVFDLSFVPFHKAWPAAKVFFEEMKDLTNTVVYVPGNHDFSMWNYLEQEISVTWKIRNGEDPKEFKYCVPGIIHDGFLETKRRCFLVGVNPDEESGYDGGYFKGLWKGTGKQFLVAYPNLYVIGAGGETALLTHGHYFDLPWSFLSELCLRCADDYLDNHAPGELSIGEFVQVNYPFGVLDSAALGQANLFAKLAEKLADAVSQGDLTPVKKIKAALLKEADRLVEPKGFFGFLKEFGSDLILKIIDSFLDDFIGKMKDGGARFNTKYVREHQDLIKRYLIKAIREISALALNTEPVFSPRLSRLIFGHTHVPSRPTDTVLAMYPGVYPHPIACLNTGGWVKDGNGGFEAAVARFRSNEWSMTLVSNDEKVNGTEFSI